MDQKAMEVLAQILEKVNGLERNVDCLATKVDHLATKVDRLETKVDGLETKVDHLETKVDKNQAMLEEANANIKALAEGLTTQHDENERGHNEFKKLIEDKTNLLKSAIARISEETAHVRVVK